MPLILRPRPATMSDMPARISAVRIPAIITPDEQTVTPTPRPPGA
jgi:hypothetical protein